MGKTIHIFGGGTVQHVRNHFALCAPAYGTFAKDLALLLNGNRWNPFRRRAKVVLHLTKMADRRSSMETNEDVHERVLKVLADQDTAAIVFNVALCDYRGQIGETPSGKYAARLSSREGQQVVALTPANKILPVISALRPDVFLVGFKTTAGDDEQTQTEKAWRQIEETGAELVWVNDTVTRVNQIISADINVMTPQAGTSRALTTAWLADLLKQAVS